MKYIYKQWVTDLPRPLVPGLMGPSGVAGIKFPGGVPITYKDARKPPCPDGI